MGNWIEKLKIIKEELLKKKAKQSPLSLDKDVKQRIKTREKMHAVNKNNDEEVFREAMANVKEISEFRELAVTTPKRDIGQHKDSCKEKDLPGIKHVVKSIEKNLPLKRASLPDLPREVSSGKNSITVGLDFGTSMSKVCVRKALGGNDVPIYPIPFSWDKTKSTYLCPSVLSIHEDKIYFGHEVHGLKIFPHLKVCIACEVGHVERKDCVVKERCHFTDSSSHLKPSDLASLFLGWIMKEARIRLPKELNNSPHFIYNIGVPLKQLDTGPLHKCYKKIAYCAWRISEGAHQGLSLEHARHWIKLLQNSTLPEPERSSVQLCPETSAAIVSYVKSPDSLPGLYSIIDIGAWTTDVSFFRLTDIDKESTGVDRLSFYDADILNKASNTIDGKIIHCLMELWGIESIQQFEHPYLLEVMRQHKESDDWTEKIAYRTKTKNIEEKSIPNLPVNYSKEVIAEAVNRFFTQTLKKAFHEKERVIDRWQNLNLFFIGGGINEKLFGEKIKEKHAKMIRKKSLSYPNLQNTPSSLRYRLAVAAGLSYPIADWPEQILPSEVSDWVTPPPKDIPDRDEQYPK
jgi:hypothetical protein